MWFHRPDMINFYSHRAVVMKNVHEIIGKAAEDLLQGKNSQFFSRELLAEHLVQEYIRVASTDISQEEGENYEHAMRIVALPAHLIDLV